MHCHVCNQEKTEFYSRRFSTAKICKDCERTQVLRRSSPEFLEYALDQALSYARRGWLVLPMNSPVVVGSSVGCSCGCGGGSRTGKHPRIRVDSSVTHFASRDEATIRQWFEWWPGTNLAIVTSPKSGVIGFDIDFSNDGDSSISEFENRLGPLREHALIAHTSNGYHMYFKHPGVDIPDFHNALPGIDIRSRDGGLVAPPSVHYSGIEYRWEDPDRKLEPLPLGAVSSLMSLLEESAGYVYTPSVPVYPTLGHPIPPGWVPGLKGNVG